MLAAATVVLLVAGVVAVLTGSGSPSDVETGAVAADDPASTVPETSTAPSSTVTSGPAATSPAAPSPAASAPPAPVARTGAVSEVVDPPDGEGCEGLRSRTVWAANGTPDEIAAAAGGRADYVETVTNEGPQTCTMVFERCPAPGVLFTAEGTPAPDALEGCPAIGHAPVDLAPGESRRDVFSAELFTGPGDLELRVPQHDGRVASLPIRLEPQVAACRPGTLSLDQQPFEAFLPPEDHTTFAQLAIHAAEPSCTIRITGARLVLGPEGDPGAGEHSFADGALRWYVAAADRTLAHATFGPVDLPPGQYEGAIVIQLEDGETLAKPARLLVG